MPAEIARAVAELHATFPDRVQVHEDPVGVIVAIIGVTLSERWSPCAGTLSCFIPAASAVSRPACVHPAASLR